MKFLRSLPRELKNTTVFVKNSYECKDFNLDTLYGVLKTYELEMQQDDEIEKGKKYYSYSI